MKKEIKINILDLKNHISEIYNMISNISGEPIEKITVNAAINNDLRIDGDDFDDVLIQLKDQFNIELHGLNFSDYFHNEFEIGNKLTLDLISLPPQLFYFLFIALTNKHKKDNFKFWSSLKDKPDLTIGDLITSKIEGKFVKRNTRKFILKNSL